MASSPADSSGFDARAFRDALSRYATGVAVVIARGAGETLAGMTINSFASVSLDPPLVLWSMRSGTASAGVYRDCEGFTISLLAAEQEALARRCARTDGAKLDGLTLTAAPSGIPRLGEAVAWFDCDVWATHPGGDHDIFLGLVRHFGSRPGATLVFQDGAFRSSDA